jgi:hypothetical protein
VSETASPVLVSTLPMHAHRCEACAKAGKEVVWIHPEQDFAQLASHKCPECGTVNWKVSKMDTAKLPQPLPRNANKADFNAVLGYLILLVGLALIGYGVYLYVQKRGGIKKIAGNILNEGEE